MKVNIYLPHTFDVSYDADLIVGVDYGAYILAKKAVTMNFAIGDFDSVTKKELELVKKYTDKFIKLPIKKDQTDSEAAILYMHGLGYYDITLIGDLGERLDHFLVNFRLVEKYQVKYLLENNKIFNLKTGIHQIKNDYQFLSLFTSQACTLSLTGTKYEIEQASINYFDTYASANEIIAKFAIIDVLEGSVNIILSNDK